MDNEFVSKVEQLKEEYYSHNKKNVLFKKSQKMDCALTICNSMDVPKLIENTMHIIPNTNAVYFSYPVFKLYATDKNYDMIISHIFSLFHKCIENFGTYQVHIDLLSYTVSACERYKPIFPVLFNECFHKEKTFSNKLDRLFIYNTPHAMETIIQIMKPLVDNNVRHKIIFYSKHESDVLMKTLLANQHNK